MSKKSTPKNGIVLVVDVGSSSSTLLPNSKTYAEQTAECTQLLIRNKILTNNHDDIAIILFGSETTNNSMYQGKSRYQHVNVLCEMNQVSWELAKIADKELKTTSCCGDWMDALAIALGVMHKAIEAGTEYEKTQIVLFSPFCSPFITSAKTESAFIDALITRETELLVVSSIFEKGSESLTDGGEVALRLTKQVNGSNISFEELLSHLLFIPNTPIKSMPWNATLDIGSSIKIPISAYIKVKKKDDFKWKEETTSEGLVERERTYHKGSDNSIMIDQEDTINGYKYGPKYIPFSREEEAGLFYKSGDKCFSLLAFVDPVPPCYLTGTSTMYVFGQKKTGVINRNAQIALSAFIQAMEETGKVALVRRVYRNDSRVRIGVLSPRIKLHYECLVYHELPFADDYRQFQFSAILTGKNPATEEQLSAVDELIDQFDLLAAEKREEFSFSCKETNDPYWQYTGYVLASKAVHPQSPVPELPAHISMLTRAPPSFLSKGCHTLERIQKLFPLEIVNHKRVVAGEPPKRELTVSSPLTDENPYKKARLDEEIESEMDLSAVLGPQVTKIGTATPVKDFLQLLCKGTESVAAICTQMEEVIRQVIIDSAGSNAALMTKSFDCLKIYRQEALNRGLIDAFNAFAVALKAGNFHIFWEQYVTDKVGLITNQESPLSKVTQADAVDFLRLDSSLCDQPLIESDDENLLDLL